MIVCLEFEDIKGLTRSRKSTNLQNNGKTKIIF